MNLNQNIVIVDYGVGNTYSVKNAIEYLGYKKLKVSDDSGAIDQADILILPGVGAFEEAIGNLKARNLVETLEENVLIKKKPILGICVGMQLFATASEENGEHEGLNWIEGRVKRLDLPENFAIPHVGWNDVVVKNQSSLFERNSSNSNFYFDHSFYFDCSLDFVSAYCDYSIKVTAAVQRNNIFGVQFHPEKSQVNGLKLFRGFFNSVS